MGSRNADTSLALVPAGRPADPRARHRQCKQQRPACSSPLSYLATASTGSPCGNAPMRAHARRAAVLSPGNFAFCHRCPRTPARRRREAWRPALAGSAVTQKARLRRRLERLRRQAVCPAAEAGTRVCGACASVCRSVASEKTDAAAALVLVHPVGGHQRLLRACRPGGQVVGAACCVAASGAGGAWAAPGGGERVGQRLGCC